MNRDGTGLRDLLFNDAAVTSVEATARPAADSEEGALGRKKITERTQFFRNHRAGGSLRHELHRRVASRSGASTTKRYRRRPRLLPKTSQNFPFWRKTGTECRSTREQFLTASHL